MITHFLTENEGTIWKSVSVQFKWHGEYEERGKEYVNKHWKVGNYGRWKKHLLFVYFAGQFSLPSLLKLLSSHMHNTCSVIAVTLQKIGLLSGWQCVKRQEFLLGYWWKKF